MGLMASGSHSHSTPALREFFGHVLQHLGRCQRSHTLPWFVEAHACVHHGLGGAQEFASIGVPAADAGSGPV